MIPLPCQDPFLAASFNTIASCQPAGPLRAQRGTSSKATRTRTRCPFFLCPVKDFSFLTLYLSPLLCKTNAILYCSCDRGNRRGKPGDRCLWRGFNTAPQHDNNHTLRIVQSPCSWHSNCVSCRGWGFPLQLKPDERMWARGMWLDGGGRRRRCRGAVAAC